MITADAKLLQFTQPPTSSSRPQIDKDTIKIFVEFIKDIKINRIFKNSEKYKIVTKKLAYLRILDKKNKKTKKEMSAYIFIDSYKANLT